jgi:hypothetical protein
MTNPEQCATSFEPIDGHFLLAGCYREVREGGGGGLSIATALSTQDEPLLFLPEAVFVPYMSPFCAH